MQSKTQNMRIEQRIQQTQSTRENMKNTVQTTEIMQDLKTV